MAKKLNRGAKKWKQWVRQDGVDERGQIGDGPAANADNFAAHHETLFTDDVAEDGKADALCDEMEDVPTDRSWRGPSREEMRTAIGELRDTAPGVSGVPSLVWKSLLLNEDTEQATLEVVQWCWREKSAPESWSIFYVTALEKKGDLTNPANHRGINTSETLSKVYSSILKNRLNLLCGQLAPECCGGFRKGRGRGDCTRTAKQTLRQNKRRGLDSCVICWNAIKCFDRLPREFTWKSMQKVGVHPEMTQAVQATLEGTACEVNVEGEIRTFRTRQGSAQGTSLGPAPCLYFFLPILKLWVTKQEGRTTTTNVDSNGKQNKVGTGINNFADDTMMIVTSEEEVTRITREFVTCVETFQVEMHKSNTATPTKPSKSVVVHVPATHLANLRCFSFVEHISFTF
jgi:hypothetical protein